MIHTIQFAGQHGIISDRQPHELPLNAWSAGRNIRMKDGYVEKFLGHQAMFGTPTIVPYWLLPVAAPSAYFWIYAGLTKVYVWDGGTHTDITRAAGGDYNANANNNWTGGVLGGIPILNNGVDVPQQWNPQSVVTDLAPLSNWNAAHSCKSIRPFKRYLIALDVTKSGVRYPFMVKWSHPAAPGGVPSSWDETDATKDAGEWELKESNGYVLDGFPMRDLFVIYKEDSIWGMQAIGGIAIFRFSNLFRSIGAISRRCAVEVVSGQHVVFSPDDIVIHDGQTARSIIDAKRRRALFNAIDTTNFRRCFAASNLARQEVWFCYPETGQTLPNKAEVWNFNNATWATRDLPGVTHIESGIIDPGAGTDQWQNAVGDWTAETTSWGEQGYNAALTRILMASAQNTRLYQADVTTQEAGVNSTAYIERTGLGFPLKVGQPPDFSTRKLLKRLWPRIEGTVGQSVSVYVGAQERVGGSVTYGAPKTFVIGTTKSLDFLVNSPLHAIKVESTGSLEWRLHGYEVDVVPAGKSYG